MACICFFYQLKDHSGQNVGSGLDCDPQFTSLFTSASEVTTVWRYRNEIRLLLLIIIFIFIPSVVKIPRVKNKS